MKKVKAKGTLARFLEKEDSKNLHKVENKMLIALRIGMAIRARGWTNKQFAEAMNCPASEVSDWLSGTRNFTIDKLSEIEDVLDVELINHSLMVHRIVANEKISYSESKRKKTDLFATKKRVWNVPTNISLIPREKSNMTKVS